MQEAQASYSLSSIHTLSPAPKEGGLGWVQGLGRPQCLHAQCKVQCGAQRITLQQPQPIQSGKDRNVGRDTDCYRGT